MEQIKSYDALAAELRAQLRPGVITNSTLRREDLEPEIEAGTLFVLRFTDALFLLRQREGFQRLNFYLQKGACLPCWQPEQTTVLEIPSRPRDTALRNCDQLWMQLGFSVCFERLRMTRKELIPGPSEVSVLTPDRLDWAMDLLERCFDRRTACLPTRPGLAKAIENGQVLFCENALIHFSDSEIRHLCVAPELQGTGLAQKLVSAASARMSKAHVWVRKDFPHAIHIYEKNGFQADPWTSLVLIYRKDTTS